MSNRKRFTREQLDQFVRLNKKEPVGTVQPAVASSAERPSEATTDGRLAAGSGMSNTDPAKTKGGNNPAETGGIDWLKLRITGRWRPGKQEAAIELLKKAQEDRRNGGDGIIQLHHGLYGIVEQNGMGNFATWCHYQIVIDGVVFGIADRDTEDGQAVTVAWVEASGKACIRLGAAGIENLARFVFDLFGIDDQNWHVSRLDVCVDVPGVGMDDIEESFHGRNFVCQARKWHPWYEGHELETVNIGKGKVKARIYDKLKQASQDEETLELVKERRWQGFIPDKAVRVEFELSREFLTDFHLDTWREVKDGLKSLAEYLVTGWLRLTKGDIDRNHADRSETCPFWQDVQQRFQSWIKSSWKQVRRKAKGKPAVNRLIDQVRGCMSSIVARLADVQDDVERQRVLDYIFAGVHRSGDFKDEVKRKRIEFQARGKLLSNLYDFEGDYADHEREAIKFVELATEAAHRPLKEFGPEEPQNFPDWVWTY